MHQTLPPSIAHRCVFSPPRLGAGLANQRLSYLGNQLVLNYTGGETCHDIYTRSTEIYFTCHPDRRPVSFTRRPAAVGPRWRGLCLLAKRSAVFDNH